MAVVRFETLVAPELSATCAVRADPSTEAVAVVREITLNASRTVFSFAVRGVADHADDGDRPLRASVGPCRSADARFDGFGWPDAAETTALAFTNRL